MFDCKLHNWTSQRFECPSCPPSHLVKTGVNTFVDYPHELVRELQNKLLTAKEFFLLIAAEPQVDGGYEAEYRFVQRMAKAALERIEVKS